MEYGIVTSYSSVTDEGYVSVLNEDGIPTGQALPFLGSNVRRLTVTNGDMLFMTKKQERATYTYEFGPPEVGDRIIFIRKIRTATQNLRVTTWTPVSEAQRCQQVIVDQFPLYRLIKTTRRGRSTCSGAIWEGRGLLTLSALYPKYYTQLALVDGLAPTPMQSFRFERKDNGDWRACKDPRVLLKYVPQVIRRHIGQHLNLPRPELIAR